MRSLRAYPRSVSPTYNPSPIFAVSPPSILRQIPRIRARYQRFPAGYGAARQPARVRRRRRVHALSGRNAGPGNGRLQRRRAARAATARRGLARAQQLRAPWRPAHETRARRLAADALHVLQRQAGRVERPGRAGRAGRVSLCAGLRQVRDPGQYSGGSEACCPRRL